MAHYPIHFLLSFALAAFSVVSIGSAMAQQTPLGEAIRRHNTQTVQKLKLDKLPTPKQQQAANKKFSEAHWHGLELIPLVRELRQEYDIPADIRGLLIDESILEAAEAGFLAGDVVIKVERYKIRNLEDFLKATIHLQERKSVRISIWRSAHTQALTGDVGVTETVKARAEAANQPGDGQQLVLRLTASKIYGRLSYANMSAAPPIQPGAVSPHATKRQSCATCHIFMNTGGQLAVDAGDIVPNPPPIRPGAAATHENRGECNLCHKIIVNNPPKLAAAPMPGRTMAAIKPPADTIPGTGAKQNFPTPLPEQNTNTSGAQTQQAAQTDPQVHDMTALQQSLTFNNRNTIHWLGIAGTSMNADLANQYGAETPGGVLIESVLPSSTAYAVGLKPGDIITHVGRIPISNVSHLREIVRPLAPGNDITLQFLRKGKVYKVEFLLGKQNARNAGQDKLHAISILIVIGIFVLVYVLVINNLVGRVIAFPLGAVLCILAGYQYGFYNIYQGLNNINYHILMFIVGMNFTTAVLHEAGFFDYLSKRIALVTLGNRLKLFLFFCFVTYFVSAFMDNIATIMVIIPLTLALTKEIHFNPKPLIIGEIIASNLGGASTMFGDFPNLLISLSTDLEFHDFVLYEMPVCIIMLLAMFIYMFTSNRNFFGEDGYSSKTAQVFARIRNEIPKAIKNNKAMQKGLGILACIIIGLIFSKQLGINPAFFALGGGIILLFVSGISRWTIVKHGGWMDVIFFTSLFIMVGAAETSGILVLFSEKVIINLSGGNPLLTAILLAVFAALFAAFVNAGPAAAIFIPVVLHFGLMPPHSLYWWALSLGIVSGASASLYGASGGPLASSIIGKFWKSHRKEISPDSVLWHLRRSLSFKDYFSTGGPILAIFLSITILYLCFLYHMV